LSVRLVELAGDSLFISFLYNKYGMYRTPCHRLSWLSKLPIPPKRDDIKSHYNGITGSKNLFSSENDFVVSMLYNDIY